MHVHGKTLKFYFIPILRSQWINHRRNENEIPSNIIVIVFFFFWKIRVFSQVSIVRISRRLNKQLTRISKQAGGGGGGGAENRKCRGLPREAISAADPARKRAEKSRCEIAESLITSANRREFRKSVRGRGADPHPVKGDGGGGGWRVTFRSLFSLLTPPAATAFAGP